MILGRCVSRAFVLSRLILALCFPPSLISTTLTNVRSINEKSIPHLRNIYRETHLESKDRKIEQSRLLLPPSFSRKIYRAAKSLQSSIRSSVIYHSFEFDVDDYYERREREREGPPFYRRSATTASPRRDGPAGQLSSFAPTPHRSRLIGLFPVNRKSRLEMSIRGP